MASEMAGLAPEWLLATLSLAEAGGISVLLLLVGGGLAWRGCCRMKGELEICSRDLRERNRLLEEQVLQRCLLQQELDAARQSLETRVAERTAELSRFNARLLEDIARHQRIAETEEKIRRSAETANQAKSDFLAAMSHEIRTPMNGVLGMTDLALATELTAEHRDYLATIRNSAQSLLSIINNILDFSKIEAGKLEWDVQEFLLHETLHDTLKSLSLRAQQKGLELIAHLEGEVPRRVRGDAGRLRQVLTNLVSNAIKFTDLGHVVVTLGASRLEQDPFLLSFSVSDTGIGIPADRLATIFEPFVQADETASRRLSGTGLGLTISRQLVQLMGGTLWVESQAGRGSHFQFTLPLGHLRDALDPALPTPPATVRFSQLGQLDLTLPLPVPNCDFKRSPLHVLLAEDHPVNQKYALRLLQNHGHRVHRRLFRIAGLCRRLAPGTAGASKESRPRLGSLRCSGKRDGQTATGAANTLGAGMKILIAEDDLVSRRLLQAMLAKWGYEVLTCEDGLTAANLLAQPDAPSLAILDWMMPGLDGVEVCRRVRTQTGPNPTYLILLTTKCHKGDVVHGLRAGADDYITKPFDTDELQARIQVGIRIVRLQENLAAQVRDLEKALTQNKLLKGLLPICCYCKKIRTDKNYWQQVESYITEHTSARFSHSFCPECYENRVKKEFE